MAVPLIPPDAAATHVEADGGSWRILTPTSHNRLNVGPTRMTNNLLPYLAGLDAPTLFFHGEQDAVVPIQGSVNAALPMPNAWLTRVPDCGHWAHVEKHDEYIRAWREFISQHS